MKRALLPPVLLLLSCTHAPPAAPPPPSGGAPTAAPTPPAAARHPAAPGLDAIRAGADAVLRAQAESYWRAFAEGASASPAGAWEGHEDLLSDASLSSLAAEAASPRAENRRAVAHLRAWLVGERLARDAAGPVLALERARAAASFQRAGHDVPLAEATSLLASEPDPARRRAIGDAAAGATRTLLPAAEARLQALGEAARALGFASLTAVAAELRGEPPAALGALAEGVLARTDATWRALLADLAGRAGMAPAAVRAADLPRLLRSVAPARDFPGPRQLEAAGAILAGLGLDLSAQPNLRIDAAARAGKLPRTVALPVDPPRDVRLSAAPLAGLEPLRALLHELGAAEYYAHVRSGPVELRRLGPPSVPATWALLLEDVTGAPEWLAGRGLAEPVVRAEASAAAARRLLRAREAAGRVLSNLGRAQGAAVDRDVALAARVLGVPVQESDALFWRADPDPLLRSAEALRAELLAAQVETYLAGKAGSPAWWTSRSSGVWLRDAWAEGSGRSAAEISLAIGQPALDAGALDAIVRSRAALPPAQPASPPAQSRSGGVAAAGGRDS